MTSDNVVVTSGATEAIAAALMAVITPGDEVVIIEPAYDAYRPLIGRAGGILRAVSSEELCVCEGVSDGPMMETRQPEGKRRARPVHDQIDFGF